MFKKIVIRLLILVVIVSVFSAALLYLYEGLLEPVVPSAVDQFRVVSIPSGSSSGDIAGILLEQGLIQNELAFRIYVRRYNLGLGFMAGTYRLSPAMSLDEIVAKIQSGETFTETVWFTVPEGLKVTEIADRLEQQGLVNSEEFLSLARQPSELLIERFPFLQEIDHPDIDFKLEGYLFPDTYEVYITADTEQIIAVMLRRLDSIYREEQQQFNDSGRTLHEILTMASIIEREAVVDHERDIIAGVFYNRLNIGMALESCATVQFALGETKEYLTYQDLEIDSPYNTYRNPGLPPGPIAASGEASILAALYPAETNYFYFNYKYDGTGEHYFSRTLQEHNQNVRRAESGNR